MRWIEKIHNSRNLFHADSLQHSLTAIRECRGPAVQHSIPAHFICRNIIYSILKVRNWNLSGTALTHLTISCVPSIAVRLRVLKQCFHSAIIQFSSIASTHKYCIMSTNMLQIITFIITPHLADDFCGFSRITAPVFRSTLRVTNFFGMPEL